jgi:hypothetical protein
MSCATQHNLLIEGKLRKITDDEQVQVMNNNIKLQIWHQHKLVKNLTFGSK